MTESHRSIRLVVRLLLWTIAGAGALALFVAMGEWSSVPVRWTDLSGWLNDVTREDAVIEFVRWLGIALTAYVTVIAGTGLMAELAANVRLVSLARLLRRLSMRSAAPVLRDRLWRTATSVAVSASTLTVSTGSLVGAGAPPAPVELTVDTQVDAGVCEGVDFVGFSGETASSEPVDPAAPVVVATPGDTLRSITAAHYGHADDALLAHVVKVNGINNPDDIAIGQIIALPAVATEIPDGAATWSSHQVVKGDTLWDILDAHYGYADADLVWHVANANGLKNPDELAIGQTITLPPVDTGAADSSVDDIADSSVVLVQIGDSLSRIAAAHLGDSDRWAEIWDENRDRTMSDGRVFNDPHLIQPGWTLRLPTSVETPTADVPPGVDAEPAVIETPADEDAPVGDQVPVVEDVSAAVEENADSEPVDGSPVIEDAPVGQASVPGPVPTATDASDVDTTDVEVATPVDRPIVVSPVPRPETPAGPVDAAPQPGDRAATPPPRVADAQSDDSAESTPLATFATLAAGGLAFAGLVALLDRRRRRRRSFRPVGRTIAPPPDHLNTAERVIRSAARLDIAERVSAAIRALGPHLAALPAPTRSRYVLADDTTVTVFLEQDLQPPAGWSYGSEPNSWSCTLDDDQLSAVAHDWTPWPAMIPLGNTPDGAYVLVDLEAIGILSLTGDHLASRSVLAALIVALSASPFTEMMTVLDDDTTAVHRFDDLGHFRLAVADIDRLVDRLSTWPSPLTDGTAHLLALRADVSPDCEPCIAAVANDLTDAQRNALDRLNYRNEPIAVITTDTELGHTELVINSDHTTALFDRTVTCHHLDPIINDRIGDLIKDADSARFVDVTPGEQYAKDASATAHVIELDSTEPRPAVLESDTEPVGEVIVASEDLRLPEVQLALDTDTDDDGPFWDIRILGDIEIKHDDFGDLSRGRRRELLTLLAVNSGGLTAQQLGLLLFPPDSDVEPGGSQDAVGNSEAAVKPRISELRKALGGGSTSVGHRYLPRAANSRYRAAHVRLDSDHLFVLVDAAHRCTDTQHRINALAAALQLVRGPIGRGELTAWAWASQHLATIEAGIVDAGLELAELATLQQNWKLVDWAATRTQLANPYEQRGLPYAIRARQELGDRSGIQRLHATTADTVDELEPSAARAFHDALARHA